MSGPEDPQIPQLDERAARAAADLTTHVESRPVPPFDPDRLVVTELPARRTPTPGRALAVAAIILALAAIAGVVVTQVGHDDDSDKAKVISGDPRPFVAGDLPDGFALAGVGSITGAAGDGGSGGLSKDGIPGPLVLYGPADDNPQLGITVFATWSRTADTEGDEIESVDLGDRTAYRYDGMGLGRHALVVPHGAGAVMVITSTMDDAWLRSLASKVTVTDGRGDLGGFTLPAGWHELSQVPSVYGLGNPQADTMTDTAVGSYAVYLKGGGETASASDSGSDPGDGSLSTGDVAATPSPDDQGMIQLSSAPGGDAQVHAGALVAQTATTTTVRGHRALLTRSPIVVNGQQAVRTVTWLERPGEVLRVSGTGLSEQELLAVAAGVEPIDNRAWKDLEERSQLGEFDPANAGDPPRTKVGEGRFADGSRWLLAASAAPDDEVEEASASLSVSLTTPGGSDSSSSSGMGSSIGAGAPATIFGLEVVGTGGRSFAGALVGPDVARVEVRTDDDEVEAEPEIVEGGGYRGIAVEITTNTAWLVAFATDGKELGRIAVSIQDGEVAVGSDDTTPTTSIASGPGS